MEFRGGRYKEKRWFAAVLRRLSPIKLNHEKDAYPFSLLDDILGAWLEAQYQHSRS